jgi:hypothetical protein
MASRLPEVARDDERPPTLLEAAGGPVGIAESSLPALVFVIAYTASGQDVNVSAGIAVGLTVLIALARLIRREPARHALSGLIGVAFAAFIATRSGKAENFFLPGLLANAAYATAFAVSIAVKWPLVGVIVGQLDGEGTAWRAHPERVTAFTRASWLWTALFSVRLLVQLPMYLAGAVVALGVARTAMGLPLFALGLFLTWKLVHRHRRPGGQPAPG